MKLKYVNKELNSYMESGPFQILDLKENEVYYFDSFKKVKTFINEHLIDDYIHMYYNKKYTFDYDSDAKIVFSIPDKCEGYDLWEECDEVFEVSFVCDWNFYGDIMLDYHPLGYLYLLKEGGKYDK